MTVTHDIRRVSPEKPAQQLRIIYQGGSIAALASASLLASAGHQVIIFEKDVDVLDLDVDRASRQCGRVGASPAPRAASLAKPCVDDVSVCGQVPGRNTDGTLRRGGVPQFRQLHTMLSRGLIDFERIVPGFKEALLAAGAVNINFLMDTCGVRRQCISVPCS